MKRIVVQEHTKIVRWDGEGKPSFSPDIKWLEQRLYNRLKRFDQRGRAEKDQVFSWSDGSTRTTQWVGVIQVPGLQVEVLPKIDEADLNGKDEKETQARSNLLYMLSVAGQVPVRERDVARLASRKASLSETLRPSLQIGSAVNCYAVLSESIYAGRKIFDGSRANC